jgi:sulfate permease, SulP family
VPDPNRPEGAAGRVIHEAVGGLSDVADYLRSDPVPPVWRELKKYSLSKFKADMLAAAMVAIVTIPQALGFAVVVGIPVQAVVATAIIGGFFCALFSSSRHLVFGPTNTISIILAGALLALTTTPLPPLQKVLVIGFLIGLFQFAAGFFKLGNLTHFISRTVIIAYTTAVGVLIAVQQLSNLLGLGRPRDVSLPGIVRHIAYQVSHLNINWTTAAIGVGSLLMMILIRRRRPRWPEGLIVIIFFGVFTLAFQLWEFGVPLVRDVGEVAGRLPEFVGLPTNEAALRLIPEVTSVALAAAILGMLECISIAKGLAARSGQKVNPNQELTAMGLGNLAASAFGAMPGSSSFVRSAVCYESGGRTQLAAMISSGVVLAILVLTAVAVNYIPIATLAAYLILVAVRLINWAQIRIARRATRSDSVVFWGTLAAALFLKLDTAVYVGIGLSLALFLKKASAPSLVEYVFNEQGQLANLDREQGDRRHPAISIVHVEGELFFGAADLFQEQVRYLADDEAIKVVILRMKNARHLDATSVMSLLQLHDYLRKTGRHLLISGINPDVEHVMRRSGAWTVVGAENIFPAEANLTMSTKRALKRANQLVHQMGVSKPEVRLVYDRKRDQGLTGASTAAPPEAPDGNDYEI